MECIIGLDIGTSSTKAIAFAVDGKVVAEHKIGYPTQNPQPGYFEQDPEEIFQAVIKSIAAVSQGITKKDEKYVLAGVGISAAMHSLIAMDDKGEALTNCIIWADSRSKEYALKIKNSKEGHDIYLHTGTPIHPMSPLCKLAWMKENMAGVFDATHKFISIKEYICLRLFGKYVVDYSIASATGLFNIHTRKWYAPALKAAGIEAKQLSELVPITTKLSPIKETFADLMGIERSTPFIIGASDGCLANVGVNAVKPGDAAVTIGTSGAIRVIGSEPKCDKKARTFSYVLTEQAFVLGGAVNSGGAILKWFKENFAGEEIREAEEAKLNAYDLIAKKAETVGPGAEGLVFLPYLMGERAPHWNPDAKGVYFGIRLSHHKAHFIRALMEGIIFSIYGIGKILEEMTGTINVMYANGGFVNSPMWVQMLADVFNKKVRVTESYESSAMGAAIVAFKALKIFNHKRTGESWVPTIHEFTPDAANHEIYMQNVAVFERLYQKLKDEF